MPLTDVAAKAARPGEKPVRLYDGGGLYLEVAPSGSKYWRLKYRYAKREKRLALGVYPETNLKLARERRDEARRQLASGVDPSASRRAERQSRETPAGNSFGLVARVDCYEPIHLGASTCGQDLASNREESAALAGCPTGCGYHSTGTPERTAQGRTVR